MVVILKLIMAMAMIGGFVVNVTLLIEGFQGRPYSVDTTLIDAVLTIVVTKVTLDDLRYTQAQERIEARGHP